MPNEQALTLQTIPESDAVCPVCGEDLTFLLPDPFNPGQFRGPMPRECACKREARKERERSASRFRARYVVDEIRGRWQMNEPEFQRQTFDAWRYEDNPAMNEIYDLCYKYCWNFQKHEDRGLLLVGWQNGTGKSHLLNSIANHVSLKLLIPAISVEVPVMMERLRPFRTRKDEPKDYDYFEDLKRVPLLVLNDIAACKSTEWAMERLFILLTARQGKATCVSMNENPFDWAGADLSRNRIRSRLEQLCDWRSIPKEAIDYRSHLRGQRKAKGGTE